MKNITIKYTSGIENSYPVESLDDFKLTVNGGAIVSRGIEEIIVTDVSSVKYYLGSILTMYSEHTGHINLRGDNVIVDDEAQRVTQEIAFVAAVKNNHIVRVRSASMPDERYIVVADYSGYLLYHHGIAIGNIYAVYAYIKKYIPDMIFEVIE